VPVFSRNRASLFVRLTAVALLALIAGCGKKNDTDSSGTKSAVVQVKGSDTMVNLAQAWAEEYKNIKPSVEIEVSGGGSGVGIAALIKGAISIATASRNMKKSERELAEKNTGKTPREYVVGYDALAIYVHKDNPLEEITVEQLAQIYGEDGTIKKWSQLGIKIPGAKRDKILRISRQSSSGTYEFFREYVLSNKDFELGSLDMNGSKEVAELVGNVKTAIGYSGMGYATSHVKMLKIKSSSGISYLPTIEDTQTRNYPLARSLLIYTLGEPDDEIKHYIEWIMSEAGQKIVADNGYVPLPSAKTDLQT
jgi:phosphate transport system substrate-binding protein